MSETTRLQRRKVLTVFLGSAGALMTSRAWAGAVRAACGITPAQTEGPFYPVKDQADKDTDLTQVSGRITKAKGDVIYVRGRVQDQACRPVAGALVEIWQACATGKYNHPSD